MINYFQNVLEALNLDVQYKKFDTNNTIDTAECIDLKVIDPHIQNMSRSILITEL